MGQKLMTTVESIQSTLSVESIEPHILRIPMAAPVQTPMGMVDSTIALLVQVKLTTGEQGWGEVWCNFPRFGAYHRAIIVKKVIEPFLKSRSFAGPRQAWEAMHRAANVLRLQSGETGPISAAIAGVDIALWDIVGQRERQPIWRLLGGRSGSINAYGSLGRSHGFEPLVEAGLERGFRAFKLRCWGDPKQHMEAYVKARAMVGSDVDLMADANSSFPLNEAVAWSQQFADVKLAFLEEPIPVDSPLEIWKALAAGAPMRIAGGENMISADTIEQAIGSGVYSVLQTDMTKWGGFSGTVPMSHRIVAKGIRFCPHMFSAAPGLLASAHLLAASNSPDGSLEYGIEYNPPRDEFLQTEVVNGHIEVGDAPGLGLNLDTAKMDRYRVPMPNL
ncbi:mandelate racemase/muconate lactonizing enzyme family protein [Comamonas sp. C11]|uniref:mandelate racemase/muconate lactonizing enzyme family protein n=1 Tax=Comamonas sp. C11 TaxID=2966554 RepID=UPI0021128EF0|nr:mandelate racemase/muconate lactonizing enzyme family protein [Comamonas sp. C11]UUC95037.1 mandelate racemase/muconate lactonizing enzyme family protein [Comamonas sp. C11]